mmetsp:Transcript_60758/g.135404  ORF Transcript_60758/g.135404 Transcript_60758/m.135404 type:complete len:206 (-) Transcript_60758:25-642(-)
MHAVVESAAYTDMSTHGLAHGAVRQGFAPPSPHSSAHTVCMLALRPPRFVVYVHMRRQLPLVLARVLAAASKLRREGGEPKALHASPVAHHDGDNLTVVDDGHIRRLDRRPRRRLWMELVPEHRLRFGARAYVFEWSDEGCVRGFASHDEEVVTEAMPHCELAGRIEALVPVGYEHQPSRAAHRRAVLWIVCRTAARRVGRRQAG